MNQRCLICKYLDKNISEGISSAIFFKHDNQHTIFLCYLHSIDYFKLGQLRFLIQHQKNFMELCLPEDQWVVEYLNEHHATRF